MYIQKISIEINSNHNKKDLIDEFGLLQAFYRSNGQTQGRIESQYITNEEIVCLPYTLEKESLSIKFNNQYVNNQILKIEKLCNSKIKIRIVGKSHHDYKSACNCRKRDFYILITNYISIDSPLTCGNCNKTVPLYKLPIYHDHGYMPILSWQTNYISCDSLQMNCEVGERWALNQMQKIDSQLSKQGIDICEKIEKLTHTPTFYYLHNYKKVKGDEVNFSCPSCAEKWELKDKLHRFYDFKCDKCKIVSTKSSNW